MTVSSIIAKAAGTSRVQSAIALASSKTGVDFDYLMGQARLESGLNTNARAGTSSASGLYQFIEQSWLAVVKKHGAENGMGWAADSIHQTASGRYTVDDAGARASILNLRNDPTAASLMAAEHASDNKDALESALGRDATGTDLYMAHFLGLGGARKFLTAMQANPGANAASLFPAAAAANRNVFYDGNGQARSLAQVYDRFATKLGGGADKLETARANLQFAAQALDVNGATVVTGNNESAASALAWANGAMGRFAQNGATTTTASLLRPTPDTARLAYMMLARLGG